MPCVHLFIDVCHLSRQLCKRYGLDAAPRPHKTACEFCTHKADPPQGINEVIVSLSLAEARSNRDVYRQILRDHGHRLPKTGPVDSSERLDAIQHGSGPGSELWRLLSELGIRHKPTCSCLGLAERMNAWGPAGCRLSRAEIVEAMRGNAKEYGWLDVGRAAAKALTRGIGWRLDLADVYGSLVDEAIRRSGERAGVSPPVPGERRSVSPPVPGEPGA
jgi:hypothetical protein